MQEIEQTEQTEQVAAEQVAAGSGGTEQEEGASAAAPAKHQMSNLGLRCITGAVYVLVLAAFFALKVFVSDLFFDAIILAFAVVGTWEMTRAFKGKLHATQVIIVMAFAAGVIVTYAVSDFVFQDILKVQFPTGAFGEDGMIDEDVFNEFFRNYPGRNYSLHITFVVFMGGISVLLALLVFAHSKVSLESTGYALLCYIYPSFLLVVLSVCNHLQNYSELALMFVFVVAPFTDVFAFFFGKLFGKKLPLKMAPNISPKKTVIGGLGGLLGGAIGAVVIFYMYYGIMQFDNLGLTAQYIRDISPTAINFVFYIGLGIVTAAFSQFGDLVESAIKRKRGIKDMGKILPGHGGILDRIDSALYAGLIVCIVMVLRLMIVG